MSTKPNTFKIGLFTLGAIGLFVAGLLTFGAKGYFTKKTVFETAIEGEVAGLSEGSSVELRGVPVGKVTRITFAWNVYPESKTRLIIVEFEVDGSLFRLPPGADMGALLKEATDHGLRAMVRLQGVTGISILWLETVSPASFPPPAIDYTPRHYYIPSAPGQITRLLESIERSLNNIQHLDLQNIGIGITNTLDATTRLVDKLNQIDLGALSTNVNELVIRVKDLSANLQQTIDSMKLASVSQNANDLLTGLRDSNARLELVLDHLGMVPMQQTVGDLREAIQNLNQVLSQLKQYPSGFIFGEPPPPAKGVKTQ
jgi:ABC-type transporter Mla subunit MlaD